MASIDLSLTCLQHASDNFSHDSVFYVTNRGAHVIMILSLVALYVINGLNRGSELGSYKSPLPEACNFLIFAQRRFHRAYFMTKRISSS